MDRVLRIVIAWLLIGSSAFAAVAYDTAGVQVTSIPVTVDVVDAPGAPPTIDLLEPAAGASITEPTAFTGTIDSPIAASWHIDYRAKGEVCQDWRVASMFTPSC